MNLAHDPAIVPPPKLLTQVRLAIRRKHYSRRTEEAYVHWVRRTAGSGPWPAHLHTNCSRASSTGHSLNGRRFSVYDAYLKPALGRSNLDVLKKAHAVRIDIEEGRAVGVTVRRGETEQPFTARGVVLAAGAFGSPQLLMLSGVGPKAALARLGITVQHDAPEVGQNLHDHPLSALIFRTRGTDTLKSAASLPSLLRYVAFKRGMLASNAVEAIAFARSGAGAETAADIELMFLPLEWRREGLEPPQVDAFTVGAAVVAPRSRGRVALRSADSLDPPVIDFGLLTDGEGKDAAALVAAARLARQGRCNTTACRLCGRRIVSGSRY